MSNTEELFIGIFLGTVLGLFILVILIKAKLFDKFIDWLEK